MLLRVEVLGHIFVLKNPLFTLLSSLIAAFLALFAGCLLDLGLGSFALLGHLADSGSTGLRGSFLELLGGSFVSLLSLLELLATPLLVLFFLLLELSDELALLGPLFFLPLDFVLHRFLEGIFKPSESLLRLFSHAFLELSLLPFILILAVLQLLTRGLGSGFVFLVA